jgi:hypothetical protein
MALPALCCLLAASIFATHSILGDDDRPATPVYREAGQTVQRLQALAEETERLEAGAEELRFRLMEVRKLSEAAPGRSTQDAPVALDAPRAEKGLDL